MLYKVIFNINFNVSPIRLLYMNKNYKYLGFIKAIPNYKPEKAIIKASATKAKKTKIRPEVIIGDLVI